MAQVFGEDPDRFVVGFRLGRRKLLGFDRGAHQAFERVGHGGFHPFARRRTVADKLPAKAFGAILRIYVDRDFQDSLVFTALHGQEPVR